MEGPFPPNEASLFRRNRYDIHARAQDVPQIVRRVPPAMEVRERSARKILDLEGMGSRGFYQAADGRLITFDPD